MGPIGSGVEVRASFQTMPSSWSVRVRTFLRYECNSMAPMRSLRGLGAQFRSDVVRCGSDAVISHTPRSFAWDTPLIHGRVPSKPKSW